MKSIGQTNAPNLFEANWNVAMQQCLCQPIITIIIKFNQIQYYKRNKQFLFL